jgi:hypothetical protein
MQNLIASGLTISGLVSSSTQCLQVNASGTASGTGRGADREAVW